MPLVAAATIAAGALAASPAFAKTLYVSTKGHDASPACAKKKPCRTIEAGVAKAHVGDTILVAPGTYNETISSPVTSTSSG